MKTDIALDLRILLSKVCHLKLFQNLNFMAAKKNNKKRLPWDIALK